MKIIINRHAKNAKIFDEIGNDITNVLRVTHIDISADAQENSARAWIECELECEVELDPSHISFTHENNPEESLYAWYLDCGRMGHLEGLVILSLEELKRFENTALSFGERLGKHSDIVGIPKFTFKTDIPQMIVMLKSMFGKVISGADIFELLAEQYDEYDVGEPDELK